MLFSTLPVLLVCLLFLMVLDHVVGSDLLDVLVILLLALSGHADLLGRENTWDPHVGVEAS